MSEEVAKPKPVAATDVQTLPPPHAQAIQDLLVDYKEVSAMLSDLEARKEAIKALLQEAVIPLGAIKCLGLVARWYPPSPTKRLDAQKLVQAGVTPKQLAAGTVVGSKKGYLRVQVAGEEEA